MKKKNLVDLEDTASPSLGTPEGEAAAARTIEAYRPENLVDIEGVSHSPATVRERTGVDLSYQKRDTLANDWGVSGGDVMSPRTETAFSDIAVSKQPVRRPSIAIQGAEASQPAGTALPPAVGPRYKRVANPYENNAPGYGGTSMIATRSGEIVDLSGKSDIGTPGKSAAYPTGAVPGFTNQDLVDLYGGPAKSEMTNEQWAAQVEKNTAMPAGWVWDQATGKAIPMNPSVKNSWQTADGKPIMVPGADGKPRPMVQTGTDAELSFDAANRTSMPALDTSSPVALLSSSLPIAYQSGQNRLRLQQQARERQLFNDKYGLDLRKMEMAINARNAETAAARSQAEIGKLNAETAAIPGKGTAAGGKLSLDQAKHITELFQMSPDAFDAIAGIHDRPEEERTKLRPQKLREMLGYGGTIQAASAAPAQAAPPVQGARQAKDGKWYVADPNRPGKYLMVNQ